MTLTRDSSEAGHKFYLVVFPDLPWVHTSAKTTEEALTQAHDALLTAIAFLIKEHRPVPPPRYRGRPTPPVVRLSATVAAKIGLHNAMLAADMSKTDLARRLGLHRPQVDQLLDIDYASTLDQLERAIGEAGGQVEIT